MPGLSQRSFNIASAAVIKTWRMRPCSDCGHLTLWRCMDCHHPICPSCEFSMTAQCQHCRSAYTGPVWQLGKRADAYITTEFERFMPA